MPGTWKSSKCISSLLTGESYSCMKRLFLREAEKLLVTSAVTFRYGLNMNDTFSGRRTFQV